MNTTTQPVTPAEQARHRTEVLAAVYGTQRTPS